MAARGALRVRNSPPAVCLASALSAATSRRQGTGNLFVVLAVLAGKSKELLHAQKGDATDSDTLVDVVVPTS